MLRFRSSCAFFASACVCSSSSRAASFCRSCLWVCFLRSASRWAALSLSACLRLLYLLRARWPLTALCIHPAAARCTSVLSQSATCALRNTSKQTRHESELTLINALEIQLSMSRYVWIKSLFHKFYSSNTRSIFDDVHTALVKFLFATWESTL